MKTDIDAIQEVFDTCGIKFVIDTETGSVPARPVVEELDDGIWVSYYATNGALVDMNFLGLTIRQAFERAQRITELRDEYSGAEDEV